VIALSYLVITPDVMLAGGMLAGLAAAYGRELSLRRRPRQRWWLSRLLLLPAAAITAVTVDNVMSLSAEARMLLAMLTILRGYDGLALLQRHRRLQLPPPHV
jgi:hypothetical protein